MAVLDATADPWLVRRDGTYQGDKMSALHEYASGAGHDVYYPWGFYGCRGNLPTWGKRMRVFGDGKGRTHLVALGNWTSQEPATDAFVISLNRREPLAGALPIEGPSVSHMTITGGGPGVINALATKAIGSNRRTRYATIEHCAFENFAAEVIHCGPNDEHQDWRILHCDFEYPENYAHIAPSTINFGGGSSLVDDCTFRRCIVGVGFAGSKNTLRNSRFYEILYAGVSFGDGGYQADDETVEGCYFELDNRVRQTGVHQVTGLPILESPKGAVFWSAPATGIKVHHNKIFARGYAGMNGILTGIYAGGFGEHDLVDNEITLARGDGAPTTMRGVFIETRDPARVTYRLRNKVQFVGVTPGSAGTYGTQVAVGAGHDARIQYSGNTVRGLPSIDFSHYALFSAKGAGASCEIYGAGNEHDIGAIHAVGTNTCSGFTFNKLYSFDTRVGTIG